MKDRIKIRVFVTSFKFINFLIYNKISYDNLIKEEDSFTLEISYSDIDKFNRYKIKVIKYYGIKGIENFIRYNIYVLIGILFGSIILYLLCNTIFEVKINTDNEQLKSKVYSSLKDNNIIKYKSKKSFNELYTIKEKILNENKESLEWIEIIEDGCNYIVELTERIIGKEEQNNIEPSNIVASKDGLILYISLIDGVLVKEKNDYVKKGDIIITGEVYKGDKLINKVNAKGVVYAEIWYTTKISIPFKYKEYVDTGKIINRYYLDILGKEMTIIGKYNSNNVMKTKKIIINKPYLFFDVYKETMNVYEYKEFTVNEKEAYNEALIRAEENIKKILDEDEYIMYKKVLRKNTDKKSLTLEVFFKVYENITHKEPIIDTLVEKQ